MDTRSLHIADPCHESWETMSGDAQRRFCAECDKHVHDLSSMTRREAEALLSQNGGLCVRYSYTPDTGQVRFRKRRVRAAGPEHQRRGAARMVANAALLSSLLSAACAFPVERADSRHLAGEVAPVTPTCALPALPPTDGQAPFAPPAAKPKSDAVAPVPDEPAWMGQEPAYIEEMGDVAEPIPVAVDRLEQRIAEKLRMYGLDLEEEEVDDEFQFDEVRFDPHDLGTMMGRMPIEQIR